MSQIKTLEDVHRVIADYDRAHPGEDPLERRQREVAETEKRQQQTREKRERLALDNQTAWISYIDNRIEAALAHQGLSELQVDVIGRFGGRIRAQLRDEFKAAIDEMRSSF